MKSRAVYRYLAGAAGRCRSVRLHPGEEASGRLRRPGRSWAWTCTGTQRRAGTVTEDAPRLAHRGARRPARAAEKSPDRKTPKVVLKAIVRIVSGADMSRPPAPRCAWRRRSGEGVACRRVEHGAKNAPYGGPAADGRACEGVDQPRPVPGGPQSPPTGAASSLRTSSNQVHAVLAKLSIAVPIPDLFGPAGGRRWTAWSCRPMQEGRLAAQLTRRSWRAGVAMPPNVTATYCQRSRLPGHPAAPALTRCWPR